MGASMLRDASALLLVAVAAAAAAALPPVPEECSQRIRDSVNWGVATAAYQVS